VAVLQGGGEVATTPFRERGQFLETETAVAEIRERIAEAARKTTLEGMTDAQKEVELTKEIEQLKEKAQEMRDYGGAWESEIAEVEEQISERELDKARLQKQERKFKARSRSYDSMIDVGNYLGSDPNRGVVDKLDVFHKDLREIAKFVTPRPGDSDYPAS